MDDLFPFPISGHMCFMATCQTTSLLTQQTVLVTVNILSGNDLFNICHLPQIAEADSVKAAVRSAGKKKPHGQSINDFMSAC